MKAPFWKVALCAMGVALAGPALAGATVIDFEDQMPGISLPGDTVAVKEGFALTMSNGIGVVDTAAAFGPGVGLDLAGPTGTSGQILIAINDGALTLSSIFGTSFHLLSFEAGFVSPLTQLFAPGEYAGTMAVVYEDLNGVQTLLSLFDAFANANGEFEMQTVSNVPELMGNLVSATFLFLTPDGSGGITWPNQNFNQFVIDNITVVPAPGTLVLALLTLGLLSAARVRRGV